MIYQKYNLNVKDLATEGAATTNGPAKNVNSYKCGNFYVIATTVTTSLALKIQGSPDGTNWVDLPTGAFASITVPGTFILEWPGGLHTLPQFIRAVATTVGATTTYRVDADLEPIC